ncbi:hypothetical protein [Trueperella pecoris]|uniref:Uncharacterized protein n=2 Tax=Trueperella pecoris TaxID=2733571 RepID=A0A7M1QX75_9ACTO|nr:hypothetical protein [Trueperella pecoris]QOQ37979.1 hypothetical protein HLG82_02265 [Trueperella pecoris]QOR46712.1 hypothetical protein INS88_07525 [Trueperella pecoris]
MNIVKSNFRLKSGVRNADTSALNKTVLHMPAQEPSRGCPAEAGTFVTDEAFTAQIGTVSR